GGAVHGEQLVVGLRRNQSVLGLGQLEPDDQRLEAAEQKEEEGGRAVQDADPLVIYGRNPAPQAGWLWLMGWWSFANGRCHVGPVQSFIGSTEGRPPARRPR